MDALLIALGALVLYLVAYHTYGRWLARKIFKLDPDAKAPSIELEDGNDYVPTSKGVVFGHHFTSIAGTGPIVGPALAGVLFQFLGRDAPYISGAIIVALAALLTLRLLRANGRAEAAAKAR